MNRIYLEQGKTRVIACSLDWPGWCRFGKTEEAALYALSESAPRYRIIAERADLAFAPDDPVIFERVRGDATTDWGAPSIITTTDTDPVDEVSTRQGVALLQAASFEAASIKPSEAATGSSSGIDSDNGLLRGHNVTLMRCIIGAYGVPEAQVLDGPKWIGETRFDITAKADHPAGDAELMTMLQSLLADRFKLALHHDTRTISGYALTVAKGGIKAKVSDAGGQSSTNGSRSRIDAVGCPMSRLIIRLSAALGVPVTDMTNAISAVSISPCSGYQRMCR